MNSQNKKKINAQKLNERLKITLFKNKVIFFYTYFEDGMNGKYKTSEITRLQCICSLCLRCG